MKILLLLLLVITTTYAQHPDDYRWDDRFSKPGISHPEFNGAPIRGALALAANADYVIVGGRFTIPGNNIALWNKRTLSWEKAGSGVWKNPSQNDYPEVNKVFADGDNVFVSGNFTTAGDIPAAGYALFNTRTKQWTSDSLFSGDISGVTRFGNDLIIHGSFSIQGTPIRNIAYWNNGQWSLFNKDTNTSARGIVALKGSLYSNVLFKDTYSFPAYYQALSRWDGTTWIPIVDTMYPKSLFLNLPIQRIQGNKDYLYLFGWIDSMKLASGSTIKGGGMLRYDGATWTTVIDSSLNNTGSMIVDGEDVYCIGYFSSIQGYVANKVAKWDHTTGRWNGLGSGINDDDNSTKLYAHLVTDNQVFVAGLFATAGSQNVNNIARYDQSTFTWYPLGDAKTQAPICKWSDYTNVFNDNNKLLVIGDFEYAGDKRLNSIGYWTGKAWENVGTGILGGAGYGPYTGITRVFTTTPGLSQFARIDTTLYLGGTFELLGTNRCDNITSYKDGITECVGGGITQSHQGTSSSYYYPASIDAMIAIGNSLYVGGNFTKAGSVQVESIAEWNGTQWSNVGGGILGGGYGGFIFAEDSSHSLIVAGSFYQAGSVVCNGLASWDGHHWKALGYKAQDSNAVVRASCVTPSGEILVAGFFTNAGFKGTSSLMRVNGDSFEQIAEIFIKGKNNGEIYVMACKGNILYVTGYFDHIGDIAAENVAMYNLSTKKWSPLGTGFVKSMTGDTVTISRVTVQSIAFIGDTVYFGGEFNYAGGKPSFNIAAWLPAKPNSVEFIGDAQETNQKLSSTPNPASSTLNFQFQHAKSGRVNLSISDVLGRKIHSVIDDYLLTGEYSINYDCSILSNGVYFVRMESNGEVVTTVVHIIH